MFSNDKIICRACQKAFVPKSGRNIFCTRKCFKKDYWHRKMAEELNVKKTPEFTCPKCGQHITLDFDPVKNAQKWLHYQCPGCNTLMINVSESIVTMDKPIS